MDVARYEALILPQQGPVLTVTMGRSDATNSAAIAMERELCRLFMDVITIQRYACWC